MPGIFCRIPDITCGNHKALNDISIFIFLFFFFSIFIILEKIGLSSGREIACRLPWSSWKWISGVFRAGLFLLCTSGNNFYMQGMGLMGLTRNTGVFNKVLPFKPWALTSVNQKLSEIVKIFAQIFRLQELLSTCFICLFFQHFVYCIRGLRFGKFFEEKLNGELQAPIYDSLLSGIITSWTPATLAFLNSNGCLSRPEKFPQAPGHLYTCPLLTVKEICRYPGGSLNHISMSFPSLLDFGHSNPEVWCF